MKTQRDIGTARVVKFCNGLHKTLSPIGHEADDDGWDGALVDIPVNTIVKLSIEEEVEEAEPKRILIVPENVVIIQVGTYAHICLVTEKLGLAIGKFAMDGSWEVNGFSGTHRGRALTESSAKQAALECLANINEHGFGWTADGQVDLLKKLTKEEVKNG